MAEPVRVGSGGAGGRDLFILEAEWPADVPAVMGLTCPYFACLLACDATAMSESELDELARSLLRAGCAYVCCLGSGCELAHDAFDMADVRTGPEGPWAMTAWHDGQPLSEALWFFLNLTYPDEAFEEGCRAAVAVCVGQAVNAPEVRTALDDPEGWSARYVESEEGP